MMTFCDVSVSVVSSWQARGQSLGRWNVSFTARWCDRRGPKRFQINRIWHLLVLSGRQVPARVPRAEAAATHRMSVLEVAEDHSVHWLRVDGDHRVGGCMVFAWGSQGHVPCVSVRRSAATERPFAVPIDEPRCLGPGRGATTTATTMTEGQRIALVTERPVRLRTDRYSSTLGMRAQLDRNVTSSRECWHFGIRSLSRYSENRGFLNEWKQKDKGCQLVQARMKLSITIL